MTDSEDIVYRVNERDEIVFVNEAWERFAAENSAKDLGREQILHMTLWEYISDPTTDRLYRDLLRRVRKGVSVRFTLRCDSPTHRRVLEMKITARQEGDVEFRARPMRIEMRSEEPLFDVLAPRGEDIVRVCSWCNRVRLDDQWMEVEEAVEVSRLFEQEVLPMVSHGICETCSERMLKTISSDKH